MEWIDKMLKEAKNLSEEEINARTKFYRNYGDIKFRKRVTCDVCGFVVDIGAVACVGEEFVCCICLYKRGQMAEKFPELKPHSMMRLC